MMEGETRTTNTLNGSLLAVHGFLGSRCDWDSVFSAHIGVNECIWDFDAFDLYENSGSYDLHELGKRINQWGMATTQKPRVLLGYSWGGRIALHSLIQRPDLWAGAILVSAHPGIADTQEARIEDHRNQGIQGIQSFQRIERIRNDEIWATRFETENWESVMTSWNSQAVFQGSRPLDTKKESTDLRSQLARSLRESSLGLQADLRSELKQLQVPILWISGERDAKFAVIHKEMAQLNPNYFEAERVPGAGHRVPWDQPQAFQNSVLRFLEKVQLNIFRQDLK